MTEPRSLSDADLLAWAVVLEYRRRQQHEGLRVLLLTFPPCPTCKELVTEAKTWWIQDSIRYDGVMAMQPCGHSHTATAADMERIHDHASEMLDRLRLDNQLPGGKAWSGDDIVREARARLGEPEVDAAAGDGLAVREVRIRVQAPSDENADQWAETIRDLVVAEYGESMRLDVTISPEARP